MKGKKKIVGLAIYFILLIIPIYWMLNMSLRSNADILASFSLYPKNITFMNYMKIFTDSSWYMGYVNSILYVALNTAISLFVALPAAYAFSRYQFVGDKQMFFWLLTNRMAPAAVFALPFFQLYSTVGLMDTHLAVALAHCLFNVPLAVWILEGFMSGVPKEIDETAFIDGYSFSRFFITIFIPLIRAGCWRHGLFLLHVQLGGTASGPNTDGHQRQTHFRYYDADHQCHGPGLRTVGGRRYSDHCAGSHGDLVCAKPHGQGFCPGPGIEGENYEIYPGMDGMDRTYGHFLRYYYFDRHRHDHLADCKSVP